MQDLKGSKTYDNLLIAYAGESQARNKYEFFAAKAQEEGYRQIAELFRETADNEKEHAEIWYKHFVGIGTTPENLMTAAEGEHYEWSEMYDDMACVAREEGFEQIVRQMERVDVNGLPFGVIDSGNHVECRTHIFSHVSLNVFYLRIHSFDGWEESFSFLLEIV